MSGSAITRLTLSKIKQTELVICSLGEQYEIVKILKHKKNGNKGNTLMNALNIYVETLEREKSIRAYTLAVKRFLKHMKGDVVLTAITPHDIQSFHNRLMAEVAVRIQLSSIKPDIKYICRNVRHCQPSY